MPIEQRADGTVTYSLVSNAGLPAASLTIATKRQRKLLRFFNIPFTQNISVGAAGWEISTIMAREECSERWRRYVFLTKDFDTETDELMPFTEAALQSVEIPSDWSNARACREFREELAANIFHDESPYDRPQPEVVFEARTFIFTGNFEFARRPECQKAVIARGGSAPDQKSVSRLIDYLVIGTKGSKAWSKGSYGNKIENAILCRREHGTPSIISEEHWTAALTKS